MPLLFGVLPRLTVFGRIDSRRSEVMADNQKFYQAISQLLDNARKQAKTAVNTAMEYTYYEIGRRIVEEEQHGDDRAAYGRSYCRAYLNI